jgi:hypothetical protein
MTWLWLGFGAPVITLLSIDLGVFHRHPHRIALREAIGWSVPHRQKMINLRIIRLIRSQSVSDLLD